MSSRTNSSSNGPRKSPGCPYRVVALLPISIIALLAALVVPVLGGSPGTETGNEYAIKVFWDDTQIASLSLDDLAQLPQVTVSAGGKDQEGPTLLSVLDLAGVAEFSEVTVIGLTRGRIASAELVLKKDQISDEVILDVTNEGATKLCGPDIDSNQWIIDVSKLVVK
jgi:hypothetical protein